MANRRLSPRIRFEVFKRDRFMCCYCGRTPPAVILEADHVIPVASGGGDSLGNLVTACADCNRGKGARGLAVPFPTPDLAEQVALIRERAEQVRQYEELLTEERTALQAKIDELHDYWLDTLPRVRWSYQMPFDQTFAKWLRLFPIQEVKDAIDLTARARGVWKKAGYFNAIMRNRATDRGLLIDSNA